MTTQPQTVATPARPLIPVTEQPEEENTILGRLISYMARGANAGPFWLGVALRLAGQLCLILVPFFTSQALNVVSTPGGTADTLTRWALFGAGAGLLAILLSYMADRLFAQLATSSLSRLQRDLFDHMQTLSLSFFDKNPPGDLISRVNNDSEAVAVFYESAVSQLIRAGIQVLLVSVIVFTMNWRLAIASLVIVPVLLFVVNIIQKISVPAFAKMQEELGELSGFQEETIAGHKVIIGNRRQSWAGEANERLAAAAFKTAAKANFATIMQTPLTVALTIVQTVVVLIVGALQVLNGTATLGEIVAFTGYAGLLSSALSDIATLQNPLQNALAGGKRVFAIMDEQATVRDAPNAQTFQFKGGHVVFDNVDFSYTPGRKILKGNSFEALPGQKIGLCGPTGAGKSTIINILTRYYDIDSGTLLIDGQPIGTLSQSSLRQQIGVVLQEAFLFTDTVMNNLKYARAGATDEACIAAAKEANAHEFIMALPNGYDTVMTERGANLSQGQRQMLTIARAMVANPKILVLDEATSNVDTRTEGLIQEGLARLMQGRTSFVIAHRLSTIRDSDKILVINAGVIVEQGSHDELMAREGFYYTLYMSQFKGKLPGGESGSATFASS